MSDDIGPISKSTPSTKDRKSKSGDRASVSSPVPPDVSASPAEFVEKSPAGKGDLNKNPITGPVRSNGPSVIAADGDSQRTGNNSPEKCWSKIDYTQPRDKMETALLDCMKAKYGATLVDDIQDADLLLSYITRNGIQEDKKINEDIQTLIESRERMRAGLFDSKQDEAKFRKSYGAIAKAAEPVTVVSFRDSLRERPFRPWFVLAPQWRKIAEIACLVYRRWAFFVLFLLLVGQIYWTATSSMLKKTEVLIDELIKVPSDEYYLDRENERRFASWAKLNPAAAAALMQTPAVASPTPSEAKSDKKELTLDELTSKVAELEANYSILGKLILPFHWFYFQRNSWQQKDDREKARANQNASPSPAPPESPAVSKTEKDNAKAWTELPPKADKSIFRPSRFQNEAASKRAIAGQIIDVMQKWFLPLLYGALGAMVFVVRTLSVQARDRLFREEARVTLVLRVFLGMISGLAIGWFWASGPQPSTATGGPMSLSTLSPFALAFVAGYAVELFFALLDKIVSTFTNKS